MKTKEPLTAEYLRDFKRITEAKWSAREPNPLVYGFQFQRGTRWNPGLSQELLNEYQELLGFTFPRDLKIFLGEMNGTDLSTINIYGSSGHPHATSVGVYSYSRDLAVVREYICDFQENRNGIVSDLADQGFDLPPKANLMPIYSHRYVICSADPESSVVLSVVVRDVDAIVFAHSLQEYLECEFLRR